MKRRKKSNHDIKGRGGRDGREGTNKAIWRMIDHLTKHSKQRRKIEKKKGRKSF